MGAWSWRATLLAAAAVGAGAGWAAVSARNAPRASLPRIELLIDAGQDAEAAALLAARLARDSHDNAAWLAEVRRRLAQSDFAGAVEAVGRIEKTSLHYPNAQIAVARSALARDDVVMAEPALLGLLSAGDPKAVEWPTAGRKLVAIWRFQDRQEEADRLMKEMAAKLDDPQDRATLAQALGSHESARPPPKDRIAALRKYLAGNPADRKSLGALALALGEDGQYDAALDVLLPVFAQVDPRTMPDVTWHGRIYSLYKAQRFDELREALAAAPQSVRIHPWFLRAKATSQQREGDLQGALESLLQAQAVNDRAVATNREVAALARRVGRLDLAAAAEQKAAVWQAREEESRVAGKNFQEVVERRAPPAEIAAAALRVAAAADTMMKADESARARRTAAYYEEVARRQTAP